MCFAGSLLSLVTEEELDLLRNNKEDLLNKAKERFLNNQDCASLKLKSHKLINDKSMADCVEALIGCFILMSGQAGKMTFLAICIENETQWLEFLHFHCHRISQYFVFCKMFEDYYYLTKKGFFKALFVLLLKLFLYYLMFRCT